jgi:ubiquinone/menaquinone biosynthesis C-methylase UbiE
MTKPAVAMMWFDDQAAQFDDSAGLEPAAGRSIAQAVLKLGGCSGDDFILDVGAGTGTVGSHFAELPSRYLGLDRSRPMLEIFRRKLAAWPQPMLLVQADGDRAWPIRDHALTVVFASRVAHHLQPQHFVGEVFRVCRSGGCLLLGQVTREVDSLPSRLQQVKRTLLAERGLGAPVGGQVIQQIVEACHLLGADPLPPIVVAQWTRTTSAGRLLAFWEGKPQLSSRTRGNVLDVEQRAAVLHTLTDWARREFGELDRPQEFSEAYTLQGVRLP